MAKATCVVKCVVVNGHDQVLLLKRSLSDQSRPGDYDFPGGGVDGGEMLEEALARELNEECGLTVMPMSLKLLYADTRPKNEETIFRILYGVIVSDPQITLSDEHDSYEWVDKKAVAEQWKHPVWSAAMTYAVNHGLI